MVWGQGRFVMVNGHPFIDYYSLLQVHPECNARTLEIAYRHLAKMYHPDHPETADRDLFNTIIEAYGVLRKPEKRASYDVLYVRNTGFTFTSQAAGLSEGIAAMSDANMHANILMYLYKKRRQCARTPGAGAFDISRSLNCSYENFEFHAWYLRKKSFIEIMEDGTFAITVEGIDHVISTSEATAEKRLRITQSDDFHPSKWAERDVTTGMAA